MDDILKPPCADERIDDLQYKGMRLIQRRRGFRFGTDSVLLASYVRARAGDRVVDIGAGTGVLSVLINARTGAHVTSVEIQPELCELERRSISMNGQSASINVEQLDLRDAPKKFGDGAFDIAVCNPPYFNGSLTGNDDSRTVSMHRKACSLSDIAICIKRLVRHGGSAFMVYPASGVFELACVMSEHLLEIKRYRFVQSSRTDAPYIVLVELKRGAKPFAVCEPPLVLYEADGAYTEEAREFYHMNADEETLNGK